MKTLIYLIIAGVVFVTSCTKVDEFKLPGRGSGSETDDLIAQRAWVEQVAKEKADSMRIVDSLINIGQVVDTTSLFRKTNLMIAIVEVNDHYFPNVNCYRDQDGKPVFDLAFAFAANLNINPSTGQEFVKYNQEWQGLLSNGTHNLVKNAGIPIGISLLGNHDAAGFMNFTDLADATAFAQLVAIEVRKYGFKAILADDEWSDYSLGHPSSYLMVMSEMKRLMPDIYLCYYIYGGGGGTYNGKQMGDIADMLCTASYPGFPFAGTMNAPPKKLFASIGEGWGGNINSFSQQDKDKLKNGEIGGMIFYDVKGRASSPGLYAPFVELLKGKTLVVPSGCLNPVEVSGVNGL